MHEQDLDTRYRIIFKVLISSSRAWNSLEGERKGENDRGREGSSVLARILNPRGFGLYNYKFTNTHLAFMLYIWGINI